MAAVLTSQHPSIMRLSHLAIANLSPVSTSIILLSMSANRFIQDGIISTNGDFVPIKGIGAG